MNIRNTTLEDIDIICHQRRRMFEDIGFAEEAVASSMSKYPSWLREQLENGNYIGWFAEVGGDIAAGAGMWLIDWQPSPRSSSERRGYVLNVYTEPDHRHNGYARTLMNAIIEYAREHQIETLVLHASEFGEKLYTSLGFKPTNEFTLKVS
ncbi:MAG: GNAT family N-acetyltransferase [Chloroflexi bacterium]|nr:GNAT family N-acetyltransferase [Chloroflexota bacterium]